MHEELQTQLLGVGITEADHLPELPGRVDVQQRERQGRGVEGLDGDAQKGLAVLADGVHQHRPLALSHRLPKDMDRFGFEALQMGQPRRAQSRLVT